MSKFNVLIIIDDKLISDEILEKEFVCDLGKCKGGCCEEGDTGAPLEKAELEIVLEMYEKIRPYLTEAAIREIDKNGKYRYDREFGWVTPTLASDREICVYGKRDRSGTIQCAFEQAYNDGLIPWKKPISCHLFPVIIHPAKKGQFERVNYEPREKLCSPACVLGKKLKVRVYEFLKEPLVRKYGEEFFRALDTIAKGQTGDQTEVQKTAS